MGLRREDGTCSVLIERIWWLHKVESGVKTPKINHSINRFAELFSQLITELWYHVLRFYESRFWRKKPLCSVLIEKVITPIWSSMTTWCPTMLFSSQRLNHDHRKRQDVRLLYISCYFFFFLFCPIVAAHVSKWLNYNAKSGHVKYKSFTYFRYIIKVHFVPHFETSDNTISTNTTGIQVEKGYGFMLWDISIHLFVLLLNINLP
jgi:hypothetical protein